MAKYEVVNGVGIIPEGVTEIVESAFEDCTSLTSVVIPEGVKNVNSAFIGCDNLSYVSFPKSVEFIYAYILGDCNNIKEVTYNGTKEDWTKVEFSAGFTDPIETHVYYFEGLKSSFEDRYVNLWDGTYIKGCINSQGELIVQDAETYTTNWMSCKPNTTYSVQGGDRNRWLMRNSLGELTFIGGRVGNETPTIRTLNDTIELRCYYKVDTGGLDINIVHQNLVIWESNDMTYEEALTNKNKYKAKKHKNFFI